MSWFQNLINRNIPSSVRNAAPVAVVTKSLKAIEITAAGAAAGLATGNPLGVVAGAAQGAYRGITTELNNGNVTRQIYQSAITGAVITAATQASANQVKTLNAQKVASSVFTGPANPAALPGTVGGVPGAATFTPTFGESLGLQSSTLASTIYAGGVKGVTSVIGGIASVFQAVPKLLGGGGGATPTTSSSPGYQAGYSGSPLDSLISGIDKLFGGGSSTSKPTAGGESSSGPNLSGLLSGLNLGGGSAGTTSPGTVAPTSDSGATSPILAAMTSPIVLFVVIGMAVFVLFGGKAKRLIK